LAVDTCRLATTRARTCRAAIGRHRIARHTGVSVGAAGVPFRLAAKSPRTASSRAGRFVASPRTFHLTGGRTPIPGNGVSVVAGFNSRAHHAISADRRFTQGHHHIDHRRGADHDRLLLAADDRGARMPVDPQDDGLSGQGRWQQDRR
jgi:hypothetical protein